MSELQELYLLRQEQVRRTKRRKLNTYYPEEGPLRRELYPKHLDFFRAGRNHRERCFLAANRVGKTEGGGGYELVLHLTGLYPDWWEGRRFHQAVRAWAAGDTAKTVRDIIQHKLLGPPGEFGTGLIPGDCLLKTTPKSGVPEAVDTVTVKHVSGYHSTLVLKSYDQGREAFQGTEQHIIWLDEEFGLPIYTECLTRTMSTGTFPGGLVMTTFTPLQGLTEVVLMFLPGGQLIEGELNGRYLVMAGWDDVPHLSEQDKDELLASYPAYQRDARTKGVPQLGSGAIYPVPESDIVCAPFEIPAHWPRAYGMDVGWNRTAAVWGALDREAMTVYLYAEYYRSQAEPSVHADAIKAKGLWIPGTIDPAARGRGQTDGQQLFISYRDLGLTLTPADNAVEAGIYAVWQRLSAGKLKVFSTLQNWLGEYRIYRRDEKGKIVKENDHLMDATRYFVMTGLDIAKVKPVPVSGRAKRRDSWMGA